VKHIVLLATLSTGRWFIIGGTGRGVFQFRGRWTDLRPLVRALDESGTRCPEMEGRERWRRAVGGFTLGGEHTTLSAASLCLWVIRSRTGGRLDSTASMPMGGTEKQFLAYI